MFDMMRDSNPTPIRGRGEATGHLPPLEDEASSPQVSIRMCLRQMEFRAREY
jgi:hypothetical protein